MYNNLIPFLALPLISSNNASILIEENDNPRGIFSFTSSSFTAEEGTTDSITVTRTAGTYGEVSHYNKDIIINAYFFIRSQYHGLLH